MLSTVGRRQLRRTALATRTETHILGHHEMQGSLAADSPSLPLEVNFIWTSTTKRFEEKDELAQ